ncbi:PTS sugar transporter subunit IIC [Bulleidia sp. zg-1006]|uniref:PTS sugar transporter subunit IIC n=1 Tax=Bulleidia sp. zg-1006 TaxID=2806552 RepID=UPI00193A06B0|nr:PTS transporter subunit EIIC [Bulleidia sp. zg-1006]QRG86495.1 PTS sugar transporter subunit IIC [Bulleidia sp. zg-1006]
MKSLEKFLIPIADALSKNKVLVAIRDGFMYAVPVIIVGSLFLLISNFPIEGWSEMIASFAGKGWEKYFDAATSVTFDCYALLSVFGIAYAYAREKGVDKIEAAVVSLICFLMITPMSHAAFVNEKGKAFAGFAFSNLGTKGIFLAMIVAIVATEIFAFAIKKKMVIKLPDGVPPAVMDSFAALIPAGLSMLVFFFINMIFANTSFGNVHDFIYQVLQAPLVGLGRSQGFEVIYQFLSTLFWFFGINGPAVTNTIFSPIHKALTLENYELAKAGLPMTNVFTAAFSDFFCNFGGGGSTLGLVIMMTFLAKSKRLKTLGRMALPAGIFGINEPIIFGFPMVLNVIMVIPFLLCPVLNTILGQIATAIGFIPVTSGVQLSWTTPIFVSGYLTTGSVNAVILQLIMLVSNMLLYYPFLKLQDNKYLEEELRLANEKKKDDIDELSFDDLQLD